MLFRSSDDTLGNPMLQGIKSFYFSAQEDIAKRRQFMDTDEFAEMPEGKRETYREDLRDRKDEAKNALREFHAQKNAMVSQQFNQRDIAATNETVAAFPALKGREQEVYAFLQRNQAVYQLPNIQVAMAAVVAGIGGVKPKTTTMATSVKRAPVKPSVGTTLGSSASGNGGLGKNVAATIPSDARKWVEEKIGHTSWGKDPALDKQFVKDYSTWRRNHA